jgi:protein dithiol:quinone oxidoreductase
VSNLNPRLLFALTAAGCGALLGFGYFLQFVEHIEPCPMCIFQRLCYMAIVLIALLGALHGPRRGGVYVYGCLVSVSALIGAGIAARQTWLQHMPADQVPACGPGLEFMLEQFPLAEVIKQALRGTGECAVVDWTFFSFSIAEWSLACFGTLLLFYCIFMATRARATRRMF